MIDDLCALRDAVQRGTADARSLLDHSASNAQGETARHVFIRRFDAAALARAEAVDSLRNAGGPVPPLAGLAVSVKDLFDVHGAVTTAGSVVLADAPPAEADCPAVARLRAAGAAIVGQTNMTEFAFSGVGINPHHGTPANPAWLAFDHEARIPGGSTSGGAVSVSIGAAHAALGSDTGGSIRIPAALQGLVGFKNTARLTPTDGAVPLSTTLDTACAITRSVRDAVLMHELLAQRTVVLPRKPLQAMRFGVPTTLMLDGLVPSVAQAFERALHDLRAAGARIEELPLPEIGDLANVNATGGFSAAEAWAWHRARLATQADHYDPRVLSRIRRGEAMSAGDYIELLQGRRHWITRMQAALRGFDAMLSPTVPIEPPRIADLVASDEAFFAANALLLRNPSVVNMLDGCALSLPCHRAGERPVGLMLWAGALCDDAILDASLAVETALSGRS